MGIGLVEESRSVRRDCKFGSLLPAPFLTLCPMKTRRKQQRSINSVSTTRWTAYVAAAAASGVAAAGSVEGEIHYSGDVSIKRTGDARAQLPLSAGASLFFKNIFADQSTF